MSSMNRIIGHQTNLLNKHQHLCDGGMLLGFALAGGRLKSGLIVMTNSFGPNLFYSFLTFLFSSFFYLLNLQYVIQTSVY